MPLTLFNGHLYLRWLVNPATQLQRLGKTKQACVYVASTLPAHNSHTMRLDNILNNPRDTVNRAGDNATPEVNNESPATRPHNESDKNTQTPKTRKPFSKDELTLINRHFSHASARKLYELLLRSTFELPSNTLKNSKTYCPPIAHALRWLRDQCHFVSLRRTPHFFITA